MYSTYSEAVARWMNSSASAAPSSCEQAERHMLLACPYPYTSSAGAIHKMAPRRRRRDQTQRSETEIHLAAPQVYELAYINRTPAAAAVMLEEQLRTDVLSARFADTWVELEPGDGVAAVPIIDMETARAIHLASGYAHDWTRVTVVKIRRPGYNSNNYVAIVHSHGLPKTLTASRQWFSYDQYYRYNDDGQKWERAYRDDLSDIPGLDEYGYIYTWYQVAEGDAA